MKTKNPNNHRLSKDKKRSIGPIAVATKQVITEYLEKWHGNVVRASKDLMLNRNTTANLIRLYNIDVDKMRSQRPRQGEAFEGKTKYT